MPDLAAILGVAGTIAGSLIDTGGTTITITRPGPPGAVNADTLAVTPAASTTIVATAPALVLIESTAASEHAMPGQDRGVARARIITRPDITAPRTGDVVTVLTSLDTRLVGRLIEIDAVPDTSAAAVRVFTGLVTPMSGGVQ